MPRTKIAVIEDESDILEVIVYNLKREDYQVVTSKRGDDGATVVDRNIDVHIRSIRKKLGQHKHLIETIRGIGYRFKDAVVKN